MNIIAFTGVGILKTVGIPTFEEIQHIKETLSVEFKKTNFIWFSNIINSLKESIIGKEATIAHNVLL